MADQITITVPEITGVTLIPNPANTGAALTMTATVVEKTVVLSAIPFTCGELTTGEN